MAQQKFRFRVGQTLASSEPGSSEAETKSQSQQIAADVLQTVSRLDNTRKSHPAMEIRPIPRSRILYNQKNNYPTAVVDELADSILQYGLQQPLTAVYLLAEDVYVLEAGHQRAAAIDRLITKYQDYDNAEDPDYQLYVKHVKPFEHGYPCIIQDRLPDDIDMALYDSKDIEHAPESVIDSEIRLIITNEVKRPDDASVRAANVSRLAKLYDQKNHGKKRCEKINVNKQIAADLHITERQVANYKVLDSLIPELREEFDRNNLSLKNGTLIARLDKDEQEQILQLIRSGASIKTDEIKALLHEKEELLKQIEEKERKIKALSNANHDEQLEVKKEQVKALQEEINLLRAKEKEKPALSRQTGQLVHADMALRAAFSAAETTLQTLTDQIRAYLSLDQKDADGFSVLDRQEIVEKSRKLVDMLAQFQVQETS